jgi:hypothetical protein
VEDVACPYTDPITSQFILHHSMSANLRQAAPGIKHFRSMLDFTPTQLGNVVQNAIDLKKVRQTTVQ